MIAVGYCRSLSSWRSPQATLKSISLYIYPEVTKITTFITIHIIIVIIATISNIIEEHLMFLFACDMVLFCQ